MKGLYLLFLGIGAWQDWCRRSISGWFVAAFLLLGAAGAWLRGGLGIFLLADLLPGLLFFAASFFTRGAVGSGDAAVLTAAGLYLGLAAVVTELFWGLLLAAVWGYILVARKKISRKGRLPFLPFFFAAAVAQLCLAELFIS